jgi:hypothetical protein
LIASADDLARVKKLIDTDPLARQWSGRILQQARKEESLPSLKYDPAKGIENARETLLRVSHLAMAYRLSGEEKYLDAARRDLLAAANFPEWEKPSFLATAEMTTAVSIGYDWLFDRLSEADRSVLRDAIAAKGLRVGLRAYESGESWTVAKHNWNLVGNAGMIVGALAVMDESPEVAQPAMTAARRSLEHGLNGFEPDGGWEEGPTYWNYGMRYLAYAVASLRSATGSMQGLERSPGLSRTGEFRMNVIGPTGRNFNFADSSEAPGDSPQMFALAWAFKRPEFATFERDRSHSDPSVFDLLWYQPEDVGVVEPKVPTAACFKGIGVATFRSAWNDPNATYVAFKGGDNRAHHGHLDIGTFVLDAIGERWAIDLGSDNYDLPAGKRWTYYRYSTPGHNTIVLDGENQLEAAVAPIITFDRFHNFAVADLTAAYGGRAKRLLRGVALLNGGRDVLVQDEISLAKTVQVAWTMHTRAAVELRGRTAVLQQNGKTMTATLLYPPGAQFTLEPATAPPPQNRNEGVSRLTVRVRATESTHVAVLFTPGEAAPKDVPKLQPVSRWKNAPTR